MWISRKWSTYFLPLEPPPKPPPTPLGCLESCSLVHSLGWRKTTSLWTRLTFNSWQPSLKCSLSAVHLTDHTVFPSRGYPFTFEPSFFKPPKPPHPFSLSADGHTPQHINTKKTSIQKNTSASIHLTTSYPDLWVTPGAFPSSLWKCCPLPWQRPVFHLCTRAYPLSYLPKGYSWLPHHLFSADLCHQ